MTLAPKAILAVVELAFYGPAFLLSIFILIRHGFNKQMGWLFITTLSILRIIGASTTLYIYINQDYSISLLLTAAITGSIGTAPLLLALSGFLTRINMGMERKNIPSIAFRLIQFGSLAALIVAINGGVERAESSASEQKTGRDLEEAAALTFLAIYVMLAAMTLSTVAKTRYVLPSEKHLLRVSVLALPFLLVRVIYTVLAAFATPGGLFYYTDTNVYAEAFMQFAMEAIVICMYCVAGFLTPKMETPYKNINGTTDVEGGRNVEMGEGYGQVPAGRSGAAASPRYTQPQAQKSRAQEPRSLWDYRPSRLIANAIRDRR